MKKVSAFITFLVVLVIIFSPQLSNARLGGAGAQFLSLGGGSRGLALGGAYTALAEGLDAIYWNPAGLAYMDGTSASFTHGELFAGLKNENAAFAMPGMGGVVGVSVYALLSGKIEKTTIEEQDGTGETYSANDFAAGVSYSRMMTDKFAFGLTVKLINLNIDKCSATTWAFDIGGTYNTGFRNLRLGFVIRNFGPDTHYEGEDLQYLEDEYLKATYRSDSFPLPMSFQMGLAYDVINSGDNRVTTLVDLVHPVDQDETIAAGVEYWLRDTYSLRLGYTERNNRGLSGGLGLKLSLGTMETIVDYSYEYHQYLDGVQRFTIGFTY